MTKEIPRGYLLGLTPGDSSDNSGSKDSYYNGRDAGLLPRAREGSGVCF